MMKPEVGKYYHCCGQFFAIKAIDRVDRVDYNKQVTMVRLWEDGNYSYFQTKSIDFLRNAWNQDFSQVATDQEVAEFRSSAINKANNF